MMTLDAKQTEKKATKIKQTQKEIKLLVAAA